MSALTLDDYAFLFTATAKGNNSNIHFMMSTEDAKKWCSSKLSQGVYCGTPWAYFWTSVSNYCGCYWQLVKDSVIDLRRGSDNCRWDEKIKSLRCKKFTFEETEKILKPYGITVLHAGNTPAKKGKKNEQKRTGNTGDDNSNWDCNLFNYSGGRGSD